MYKVSRRTALKSSSMVALLAPFGCGSKNDSPSDKADLGKLDAVATSQAVRNGDVSATEMINAAIERAEAINPKLNAIITPYFDTAREKAASTGEGPWFGVPSFVKDLNNVIGQRTTYGSRAFKNYIATEQSPFIDKFFANGLISLGKSASPEFGLTGTTESMLHGATLNPWNTDHSTGGSSGGAAALVAAHVVPVAHASDGGGSIRVPASCCGTVGLKPSRGRTPLPDGAAGRPIKISQHCIESRTVRDTAAFIAMTEIDSDLPKVGLVEGPSSTKKKIAFFTYAPSGASVDPAVIAETEKTAKVLEELGHEVSEISSPFDSGVLQDFTVYWGAGAAQAISNWEQVAGRQAAYNDFEPWTYGLVDYFEARKHTLGDAIVRLKTYEADYRAAFTGIDLILSPTLATPAPKIGYLATTQGFPLLLERVSEFVAFTQFMNVAGAPAASLPTGVSPDGLPIGVQIAALPGDEKSILEVAYDLEEAMPWSGRKPTLA